MLSNKGTFSLTILVVMLVLAFVASHAFAGDFKTELSIEDVSFADKSFPEYQHDTQVEFNTNTTVSVKFDKVVRYANGPVVGQSLDNFDESFKDSGVFTYHDVVILIYNEIGQVYDTKVGIDDVTGMGIAPRDPNQHDGKNYKITFDTITNKFDASTQNRIEDYNRVLVYIKQGGVTAVDPAVAEADSKNAEGAVAFDLVYLDGRSPSPPEDDSFFDTDRNFVKVPSVSLIETTALRARSGVIEPFEVTILLSEQPKSFTTDHIDVVGGKATNLILLGTVNPRVFGSTVRSDFPPTGRRWLFYTYLVTIEPKFENKNDIVIKVKEFEDLVKPTRFDPTAPYRYTPPTSENEYVEGFDKLTVKVGKEVLKDKTAGIEVKLLEDGIIPKDGYLVVTKSRADSAVRDPSGTDDADDPKEVPSTTNRQPFGRTYNIVGGGLPNLETFLTNGGTIDLVAPAAGLVISEIMWGSDASIIDSFKSQYIEIRNTSGSQVKMGNATHKLMFYDAGQTLPDMSVAANNIQDRVGTVGASGYWSVAGKGQSGRTGVDEAPGDLAAITPTQELVSMQRSIDTTGVAADGTMASSWVASEPPGLNFDPTKEGTRIGSPGRAPVAYPVAPTPEPEPVTVPVAMPEDIRITEIMVDTGDGRLPQWIELTNVSGAEVSLAGWSLMITNSDADADVIGATVSINLSGVLGVGGGEDAGGTMGKSLLLVGGSARSSSNLAGSDRVVDISSQVDQRGRYTFISTMAFMAALIPPQETGVLAYGDTAGNLDADAAWDIPMSENGRSSLIRREMLDDGMATMGTAANGWILASSTSLVSGPATWYGSDEDAGTPGYDAGGPLPVELSHFRPARDKATGAVVITWSTQSELNNAGFFIKRSQQRDGQFQVINAAMVQGAGTTSEKQFYTYTDTTAQPNVVYYYQIEDVSLDGNRQTLTNGIRLKGHIGAAGKLTTTWGDLKTSD